MCAILLLNFKRQNIYFFQLLNVSKDILCSHLCTKASCSNTSTVRNEWIPLGDFSVSSWSACYSPGTHPAGHCSYSPVSLPALYQNTMKITHIIFRNTHSWIESGSFKHIFLNKSHLSWLLFVYFSVFIPYTLWFVERTQTKAYV